jgi:hypothetical protein
MTTPRKQPSRQTDSEKIHWVIQELKANSGNFHSTDIIEALNEVHRTLEKAEEKRETKDPNWMPGEDNPFLDCEAYNDEDNLMSHDENSNAAKVATAIYQYNSRKR